MTWIQWVAPLGNKSPEALATVFRNSMLACSVYSGGAVVGAGRALATAWTAPTSVMGRCQPITRGGDWAPASCAGLWNPPPATRKQNEMFCAVGRSNGYWLDRNSDLAIWPRW